MVTHELGSVNAIIDRCIVMDRESRRLIGVGTPDELHHSLDPHVQHFFGRIPEAA